MDEQEEAERQRLLALKAERAHVRRSDAFIRSLWLPLLALVVVGGLALSGAPERVWGFALVVFAAWMLLRWFWTLGR